MRRSAMRIPAQGQRDQPFSALFLAAASEVVGSSYFVIKILSFQGAAKKEPAMASAAHPPCGQSRCEAPRIAEMQQRHRRAAPPCLSLSEPGRQH
jgi:hypothetical protein